MPTIFIVLNGPPGSGKTTVSRELCRLLKARDYITITDSFAAPMKHFIATALGMQYGQMPKEAPRAELSGYSVREFLIDLSETYIKPRYGEGIFGRWLQHRIGRIYPPPQFVICDDSGFLPEYEALGMRHAKLVRIERPNKDFINDSRSYLPSPDYVLENKSDLLRLFEEVERLAKWCDGLA